MNTKTKQKNIEVKKINVTSEVVNFRDIEETELNAQQMDRAIFNRLVKNLKRDGVLTSTPLIMKQENSSKFKCISGHHRIKAAIKAGILSAHCLIIDEVDESTRLRLQLSHNDIKGESDESILAKLQEKLNNIDIKLVDNIEREAQDDLESVEYDVPEFSYINICLIPESRDALVEMIMKLQDKEDENILIEKPEYDKIRDLLTMAFERGFKTPGQAFGKFLDIIKENKHLIER